MDTERNYPQLPGPFGGVYSHAHVLKIGNVKLVLAAGITGEDAGPDIRSQTERIMERIQAMLRAEGGDLENVLRMTLFVTDMREAKITQEVRAKFLAGKPKPGATLVEVSHLFPTDAKVEIEITAAIEVND